MLKIRFKNNKYNAVWLVEPKVTIGRLTTNDLVIDDPMVAETHMEVLVEHEQLTLKNLVPTKPVKINGSEVTGMCTLKPNDVITLGAIELQVIDPKREPKEAVVEAANPTQLRAPSLKTTGWALKANHTALANRVFPVKELSVVGRATECDISLAAAHLSRRHAQLQVQDGLLYVKDLGSANGTFLNGKQVTEARVKRGDELRFDTLSFGVIGPADDLAQTTVRATPKAVSDMAAASAALAVPTPPIQPSNSPPLSSLTRPRAAPSQTSNHVNSPNSTARPVHARPSQPREGDAPQYGKYGMTILIIIAIAVVAALYFTRS